jgi:glycosyltransferase involved in cell wall biosynthesis
MLQVHTQEQWRPLVSVCVPTYNYARFLPDCIESVLQQTFSDWELVIADDCSDDGTADLVRRYARSEPRIRYTVNERRLGMNANLQCAANLGKGRYLKMLCADDWLAPSCLEVLFRLMEQNTRVVLATCAEIHTDEVGRPLQQQFFFGKPLSIISGSAMLDRMARIQGFGGNSSFFVRQSAYQQVGGYDPMVLYAGDWELGARLCRLGDYLHTDEPLFYGRSHPTSSSANDPKKLLDVIDHFVIPERAFRPRRFLNREWRRYRRANMFITARSLINALIQYGRGNRDYAFNVLRLVIKHGNLPLGLLYLPIHAFSRLYNYAISRPSYGDCLPPKPGMGTPSHWEDPMLADSRGAFSVNPHSSQTITASS